MSSYLTELEQELSARPNEPITAADLLRAVRAQAQAFEEIVKHRDSLAETVLGLAQAFAELETHRQTLVETVQFVNALEDRLLLLDNLPEDAPLGALIRIREGTLGQRATLYLGNGNGQPITKLPVPVAV